MSRAIYIAMTTHNFQMSGMNIIVAAGHDKKKVREYAEAKIGKYLITPIGTDIYADTEMKNLIVVSKTEAERRYGFDWDQFDPQDRWVDTITRSESNE